MLLAAQHQWPRVALECQGETAGDLRSKPAPHNTIVITAVAAMSSQTTFREGILKAGTGLVQRHCRRQPPSTVYANHRTPLLPFPSAGPSCRNSGKCPVMLVSPSDTKTESCEEFRYRTLNLTFLANCYSQLNRRMRNIVDASPTIQYRVELLAASVEDNLRKTSVTIADRRVLLEQYRLRWDKLQGDKHTSIALPSHIKRVLEGGVLGCIVESGVDKLDVHFIQLPSVSRDVRLKRWVVRGLPKCDATLKFNPEVDLLVVPEVVNKGRYVVPSHDHLLGDDPVLSTIRIHILRLSDGFPHNLAPDPVMHYVEHGSRKILSSIKVLASRHRLVAIAALQRTSYFGRHNTLVVWDWRSGERVLVRSSRLSIPPPRNNADVTITKKTTGCWVNEVQFLDEYKIIGITRPEEESAEHSLVMWDTTTANERQLTFGMPTGGILYKPKGLVDYSWAPAGIGLHRSDPARRAVGVLCRVNRGKAHKDDGYMIVINAGALRAHGSKKCSSTTKIPWKAWEHSTTVIQTSRSATKAISISGGWLFAMMKGFSGWNFIELLRVYDFSAGTQGGRYPNRPPARDVLLNLGRGTVDEGKKDWCFAEDNLLLFHVSLHPSLVREEWVWDADACSHRLRSPMDESNFFYGHCESLHRYVYLCTVLMA